MNRFQSPLLHLAVSNSPSNPDYLTTVYTSTTIIYLPLISEYIVNPSTTPTPTSGTTLYCDNLSDPLSIPDDLASGVDDQISITDVRLVTSLNLYLNISHSWVGDLVVSLTNQTTGQRITAINRPGVPNSELGCWSGNIISILGDRAAQPAEEQCASYAPAISGIFQPEEPLSYFNGTSINGKWNLNVSDRYPNDTGKLNHWCLEATLSEALPAPTPTPTPIALPVSASINGMSGLDQLYTLDCESRSAVDWANHFGVNIDEVDFLNHLPASDDPEVGFVGDADGTWGNIPPSDYGVYAAPVAAVLRSYGLIAKSFHSLQWDDLRAEIAAGKPAIVWVIGGVSRNLVNGIPYFYTPPSTGNVTIVGHGEHTVILVGYTPDTVTLLNGSRLVEISLDQFLDSWSVLNFMAILARP